MARKVLGYLCKFMGLKRLYYTILKLMDLFLAHRRGNRAAPTDSRGTVPWTGSHMPTHARDWRLRATVPRQQPPTPECLEKDSAHPPQDSAR